SVDRYHVSLRLAADIDGTLLGPVNHVDRRRVRIRDPHTVDRDYFGRVDVAGDAARLTNARASHDRDHHAATDIVGAERSLQRDSACAARGCRAVRSVTSAELRSP